jgi:hypothetical protein
MKARMSYSHKNTESVKDHYATTKEFHLPLLLFAHTPQPLAYRCDKLTKLNESKDEPNAPKKPLS